MNKKQTKQTKQSKPGKCATVRRYIVEWQAEGNSHCKTFPNLPRAQGYAKELTDTAIWLVKGGHDEDGDLAALVESVRIYAAKLELVEMTKSEIKMATISQPHRGARRIAEIPEAKDLPHGAVRKG